MYWASTRPCGRSLARILGAAPRGRSGRLVLFGTEPDLNHQTTRHLVVFRAPRREKPPNGCGAEFTGPASTWLRTMPSSAPNRSAGIPRSFRPTRPVRGATGARDAAVGVLTAGRGGSVDRPGRPVYIGGLRGRGLALDCALLRPLLWYIQQKQGVAMALE